MHSIVYSIVHSTASIFYCVLVRLWCVDILLCFGSFMVCGEKYVMEFLELLEHEPNESETNVSTFSPESNC